MEIVPFELAKKLKEKGFRGKCRESYREGKLISNMTAFNCKTVVDIKISYNALSDAVYTHGMYVDIIDAPAISQVLKWLREEKKFHIAITLYQDDREQFNGWDCTIIDFNLKNFRYIYDICRFKNEWVSYESAALAGIKYVINKLI